MPDLASLRESIVFRDTTANTKIIGEYTVLTESGFIHCVIGLHYHSTGEEDTIHFFRFEKKMGAQVWEQTGNEAVENLSGKIVFPRL